MSQNIPSSDTFDVVLDKTIDGQPVLNNPRCTFSYNWNFSTNMGLATLDSIDGTKLDITLHPTGLSGMLAFMSDMSPTTYNIDGKEVVLNRIVLNIMLPSGEKRAGIMFNEDGAPIQLTSNWPSSQAF